MSGYASTTRKGHPVANRSGGVWVHRMVLYDSIGPGPHPCHWCDAPVDWGEGLTADHLNWDRRDNRPCNLVPSCMSCNSTRFRTRDDRGINNPNGAKLSPEKVLAVRNSTRTNVVLGEEYGVHENTIGKVKRRILWAWVPD